MGGFPSSRPSPYGMYPGMPMGMMGPAPFQRTIPYNQREMTAQAQQQQMQRQAQLQH